MYKVGDVIDGNYTVTGVCSEAGGMGAVVFVQARVPHPFTLVLKYCRETADEYVKRFRRETRLLTSYAGNSKVVNVVASNPDHDPPYVVMRYYQDGDLAKAASQIRTSYQALENVILQMIEALQELHSRGHFHRDIKPQNFLLDGSNIVVSDFGLTTEVGSETAFTRSSAYWGTHGYIPPEFLSGGFKNADASGDIFMLGKTIFNIATGRDALYIIQGGLPAPLYHVIDRCCSLNKLQRYQSLADLRQSVVAAFDVILNRGGGLGRVKQLLSAIEDRIQREQRYDPSQVGEFVEQLALLDAQDKVRICMELPNSLFSVLSQTPVQQYSKEFLASYAEMVDGQSYNWSYAEAIASKMKMIFSSQDADSSVKGFALDLAIKASIYMNRYAAMDTCIEMIRGVKEEPLGSMVAALINKHRGSFVDSIEPIGCGNESVVRAIQANNSTAS